MKTLSLTMTTDVDEMSSRENYHENFNIKTKDVVDVDTYTFNDKVNLINMKNDVAKTTEVITGENDVTTAKVMNGIKKTSSDPLDLDIKTNHEYSIDNNTSNPVDNLNIQNNKTEVVHKNYDEITKIITELTKTNGYPINYYVNKNNKENVIENKDKRSMKDKNSEINLNNAKDTKIEKNMADVPDSVFIVDESNKTIAEVINEIKKTHNEPIYSELNFNNNNDKSLKHAESGKEVENRDKEEPEYVRIEDIKYRFVGPFLSFKEKEVKRRWRRRSVGDKEEDWQWRVVSPELSRSQYSLVSCGDLTQGAVQLWMGLPEEVKNDPTLAPFKQLYEKEYGKLESRSRNGSAHKSKRLPFVNSAPHLNNNLHIVRDDGGFIDAKPSGGIELPPIGKEEFIDGDNQHNRSLLSRWGHYVKMMSLLAAWLFFTVIFLLYNEKEDIVRNTSVVSGETKSFTLPISTEGLKLRLHLSGPFLSEQYERKLNSSALASSDIVELWLERWTRNNSSQEYADGIQSSSPWRVVIDNTELDFNTGESRSSVLSLAPVSNVSSHVYSIRINTTSNETVPFRLSYQVDPLDLNTGVIYAAVLLCLLYVLIIFEIINRTMAAIILATVSLAVLALTGQRPSLPELVSWLDAETLLLLFSMMLLVAIMAETGMFDFLAVFTFEVTKGKLWPLITLLCAITALLSTFLDNVTTVLLMTPVTIRLCEVMDLNPVPILMSMVLFSNIGGTATPVGDPPNVIIASNKLVIMAGINFTTFTLHMTLGILLVCVQTYFQLRFMYRDTSKLRLNVPREIQDLRHQISIWRRAAESLPHLSKDEQIVRERLERKVQKLTLQLQDLVKESRKRACPKDTFQSTLDELKDKYKIRDKVLLIKATIALSFVVAVFFMHSIPELNRVSLGWTALLGAILLLILADREDLEPILHRVEWSTLLFFAALFVLMEALSKLGLIEFIGGLTENLILSVDEKARLAVALLLMLWVSGITSAFVDNIPLTTMMVRIVTSLGSNPHLNLPMAPLIWALAFGACLGGNGTLIGASANVVCAGVAGQHGYKFTFLEFFKVGFPVMIGHLIVASAYLMLCHCVFTWH